MGFHSPYSPLIRPAISWGKRSFGGGTLDSHEKSRPPPQVWVQSMGPLISTRCLGRWLVSNDHVADGSLGDVWGTQGFHFGFPDLKILHLTQKPVRVVN